MPTDDRAPGCRETALVTSLFLLCGSVLMAIGLSMIGSRDCSGLCEMMGLAALYAGGPVSALFGVLLGGVTLAWPLDVTFWVGAGFLVARTAEARGRRPVAVAVVVILIAMAYGLVLSQFVELNIPG